MADKTTKIMSLSIRPEMHTTLKVSAKQVGCSVSELIRRLVDKHLDLVVNDDEYISVILKVPTEYRHHPDMLSNWLAVKSEAIAKALGK